VQRFNLRDGKQAGGDGKKIQVARWLPNLGVFGGFRLWIPEKNAHLNAIMPLLRQGLGQKGANEVSQNTFWKKPKL